MKRILFTILALLICSGSVFAVGSIGPVEDKIDVMDAVVDLNKIDLTLTLDSLAIVQDTLDIVHDEVGALQADLVVTKDSLAIVQDTLDVVQDEIGALQLDQSLALDSLSLLWGLMTGTPTPTYTNPAATASASNIGMLAIVRHLQDMLYGVPAFTAPGASSFATNISMYAGLQQMDNEIATLQAEVTALTAGLLTNKLSLQSITNIMTVTDGDTTWAFTVTDSAVAIVGIDMVCTTANQAVATNVQMVTNYLTGPVVTSMSADYDLTGFAIGSRLHFDLSNFANAPTATTIGVPSAASDIQEEGCDVYGSTNIGFETGESPDPNGVFNVTLWYYSNKLDAITVITP